MVMLLKIYVFLVMAGLMYFGHTNFVHKSHLGNAVTIAYEKGDMKKLASLKCKVLEPKDKTVRDWTYQMSDGKKVTCDIP